MSIINVLWTAYFCSLFPLWAEKYPGFEGKKVFCHKISAPGLNEAFQSQGRAPVGVLSSVGARARGRWRETGEGGHALSKIGSQASQVSLSPASY